MNGSGYLKFLLTALVVAVIVFGYLIVSAIDRVRESNLALTAKIDRLPERLAAAGGAFPARQQAARGDVDTSPGPPLANVQFYDPAAVVGGRMIQATAADTANMNRLINNDSAVSTFYDLCNSTLAESNYEKPEELQPLMAESWTISEDHKTYRIKLRKGIYWHDFTDPVTGKEFRNVEVTAADFRFFIDVVKNKDVNCEPYRVYFQDLESLKVINDYEFEVTWSKAYYGSKSATLGMLAPLPRQLYWNYDGPFDGRKFNDDHVRNRMLIGCGPYIFVKWEKDRRVIFRRNPRYFGIQYGAAPALEYVVYELIKHPNTRFQALLAGELDRLDLTPDQWINRTGETPFQNGTLSRYHYLSRSYSYIGWNLRNPLFADAKVRQALTMLIDREKIRKDVYFDLAQVIASPFFPESRYDDPSVGPLPYDPVRAKELLAEAGWKDEDGDGILEKNGLKFTFTMLQVATSTIQQKMLPMIKETLGGAGIDMKIQNMEWSVLVQRLEQRNFEACCMAWTSPFDPDPYQVWHSSQADIPGSSNHIGFKNAEADRLIEELRGTFDLDRRIELAHRFVRLIHEEQPYTFLFTPYALVAQSARYRNVRVFPGGMSEQLFWVPKAEQKAVPGL